MINEVEIGFRTGTTQDEDGTFKALASMSGFRNKKEALKASRIIVDLIKENALVIRKDLRSLGDHYDR